MEVPGEPSEPPAWLAPPRPETPRVRPRVADPSADRLGALAEASVAALLLPLSLMSLVVTLGVGWIASASLAAVSIISAAHSIMRGRATRLSLANDESRDRRGERTAESVGSVVLAIRLLIGLSIGKITGLV